MQVQICQCDCDPDHRPVGAATHHAENLFRAPGRSLASIRSDAVAMRSRPPMTEPTATSRRGLPSGRWIVAALLALLLAAAGCASLRPESFAQAQPRFEPEKFFTGPCRSWGVIEDRSGRPRSRFRTEMMGRWENGELVITQDFTFEDGRRQQRVSAPAPHRRAPLPSDRQRHGGHLRGLGLRQCLSLGVHPRPQSPERPDSRPLQALDVPAARRRDDDQPGRDHQARSYPRRDHRVFPSRRRAAALDLSLTSAGAPLLAPPARQWSMSARPTPLRIATRDGWSLHLASYPQCAAPAPAVPATPPDPVGTGSAPPAAMLLGAGMMLDGRAMDRPAGHGLASFFQARGFAVYSLDLRGHGESGPPRRAGWTGASTSW